MNITEFEKKIESRCKATLEIGGHDKVHCYMTAQVHETMHQGWTKEGVRVEWIFHGGRPEN